MRQALEKIGISVLDFILPAHCPITGEPVEHNGALSPEVWAGLQFIREPQCIQCGLPFAFDTGAIEQNSVQEAMKRCTQCLYQPPSFDKARARLIYNDTSRQLLLRFKHGDQLQLKRLFTPYMLQSHADLDCAYDYITAVPIHPYRLLKRRYNQAAILSQTLAGRLDNKAVYTPDLLKRVKHTKQQEGDRTARRKNVSKAFIVHEKYKTAVRDKAVLIVDDVYTTGATVDSCARTLKRAGAARVDVLTLARVVRDM